MSITSIKADEKNFTIIESGSVAVPIKAQSFTLETADLTFVFEFGVQDINGDPQVTQISRTEKSLHLQLINFESSFGASWQSNIGTLNDKPLSIVLVLNTIGTGDSKHWSLVYSLLTSEAEK